MSSPELSDPFMTEGDRYCATARSLLKEYTGQLEQVRRGIESILDRLSKTREDSLVDGIKMAMLRLTYLQNWSDGIMRASIKLSSNVSQMVEHGGLNDVTRMELEVRLADLEGRMSSTRVALSSLEVETHKLDNARR